MRNKIGVTAFPKSLDEVRLTDLQHAGDAGALAMCLQLINHGAKRVQCYNYENYRISGSINPATGGFHWDYHVCVSRDGRSVDSNTAELFANIIFPEAKASGAAWYRYETESSKGRVTHLFAPCQCRRETP